MNIADVPCPQCSKPVKVIRQQFGADPLVVLNAVPDHVAGDFFLGPKYVEQMCEDDARMMRAVDRPMYSEHACPNGAA